jgi:hypothetical protein
MCNYTVLFQNSSGYIIRCKSCDHFQLAFGTTTAAFDPVDFDHFCRRISQLHRNEPCNGFEMQKRFSILLSNPLICLALNYRELHQLADMLHEACFVDEMETLFKDLNVVKE